MKTSNWTTNAANQTNNDLDLLGFTRFVAKTYQAPITRFWGKIFNSNFYLCEKLDILQLCLRYVLSFNGNFNALDPKDS